jgi:hypothetical protein
MRSNDGRSKANREIVGMSGGSRSDSEDESIDSAVNIADADIFATGSLLYIAERV